MSNTYIGAMRPMPSSLIQCSAGVLRVRSAGHRVSRRPSWGRSKSSKLFWYKYNDDISLFRWVDNCHDDVKEMVSKTAGASAQSKLHYWSLHCSLLCTRFKKCQFQLVHVIDVKIILMLSLPLRSPLLHRLCDEVGRVHRVLHPVLHAAERCWSAAVCTANQSSWGFRETPFYLKV